MKEAHSPEAFGGSFQRRKEVEGDKNMALSNSNDRWVLLESGLIDKNMALKNSNDHWAFLANEVVAAKFMKRKTKLVEAINVENVVEVVNVGNVVVPADGGTNPVESMLKFTGRMELKDVGV
ncbi:hypothetical protein D8674_005478 [Pyrus ussuriensis x Pyrus communis]|uniref:Uncharacterized protein n=1 Tax=Pyrus ussuriensis x Pyrus communis TaxID=2448454 RepID=A0A5N5FVZ2_9ROSA|nr:hypothetical protein D8674_005478 [Pyrus ussuriensis x Pyrus communis]